MTTDQQHSGLAATAVVVAFGVSELDLRWIDERAEVIIVHHDDLLRPAAGGRRVIDLVPAHNAGFGAGVNVALTRATGGRLVVSNPDIMLQASHWEALLSATPHEIVTVPLVDGNGIATSVINRYPTPLALVLAAYRVGRYFPRASWRRRILTSLLGSWGTDHSRSFRLNAGTWSLGTHWVSGAVFSIDAERLRAVAGFDEAYFLYYEDVDLCRRLGRHFPDMTVRMAEVSAGVHSIGGSALDPTVAVMVEKARCKSAWRYAGRETSVPWKAARAAIGVRCWWLGTTGTDG